MTKKTALVRALLLVVSAALLVVTILPATLAHAAEPIVINEGTVTTTLTWKTLVKDKRIKLTSGKKETFRDDLAVWTRTVNAKKREVVDRMEMFIVSDPNALSGVELAQDEARYNFATTGIPQRAFYNNWGLSWHFVSVTENQVVAKVELSKDGQSFTLEQTSTLYPDGYWRATYTEGGQEVSAESVANRLK